MAKRMSNEAFENLVSIGFGTPPRWCGNAIATDKGWTNPKTGEVLLASRGLASRINEFEAEKKMRADEAAKKKAGELKIDITLKVEEPVESIPVEIVIKKDEATENVSAAPEVKVEAPKTATTKSGKKNKTKTLADKASKE